MARNLGYYDDEDTPMGVSYLRTGPSNKSSKRELPSFDKDYSLKVNEDNFGDQGLSKVSDHKLSESTSPSASDASSNKQALAVGKGTMKVIAGYMEADAIRKNANYEADILQLNADLSLFEAGEQRGVDFSKIIRYGEEVESAVNQTRATFAELEQEGGAAQDIINENNLQGQLNVIAMINEANARVSSAEFGRRLAYLKAQNMRDISKAQGRQAVLAGYIGAASDVASAFAGGAGGGAG